MFRKISQSNYIARGLEEGIDAAYELYRLHKMKQKLTGGPNKELAQNDPLLGDKPQAAPSPMEMVNLFLGKS